MSLKERISLFSLVLLIAGTACGLTSLGGPGEAEPEAAPTALPTDAPGIPVSINEGLASLDSYRLTYTTNVLEAALEQRTVTTTRVHHDGESSADYRRTETTVTDLDGLVVSEDVEEQFLIGDLSCDVIDGLAEATVLPPTARAMSDLMSQVVVIRPLIENPVFVGEEVMSGVPVRRYSFELRSVGAGTEVEATRSDGEYAVAVDGDYLVYYRLDLELRTGPEGDPQAEASAFFIEMSLESINQPVSIELPPECQAADLGG